MKVRFYLHPDQAGRALFHVQEAKRLFPEQSESEVPGIKYLGNLIGYHVTESSYSLSLDDIYWAIDFEGSRREYHDLIELIEKILWDSLEEVVAVEGNEELVRLGNIELKCFHFQSWEDLIDLNIDKLDVSGLEALLLQIESGEIPFSDFIVYDIDRAFKKLPFIPEYSATKYRESYKVGTLRQLLEKGISPAISK